MLVGIGDDGDHSHLSQTSWRDTGVSPVHGLLIEKGLECSHFSSLRFEHGRDARVTMRG